MYLGTCFPGAPPEQRAFHGTDTGMHCLILHLTVIGVTTEYVLNPVNSEHVYTQGHYYHHYIHYGTCSFPK